MPIDTMDPGREHDQAFFQEFELDILDKEEDIPIKTNMLEAKKFGPIPNVLVLDMQPISIANPSETWKTSAEQYFFPLNVGAVVNLVKSAEANHKKIRGIGQRHSFSEVCLSDDYFIDLSKTHPYKDKRHNQTVGKIDQSALSLLKDEEEVKNYFDVPGGMQVFMINKILCPDKERHEARFGRRRMYNMGGADVQSFAGALSTGTHGSGGIHSAYHDMVRSILLVAGEGKVYRIEPSKGITDKVKHNRFYEENPDLDKVELIQDDDKFYAVLVSFGCFGVIYSAIIETRPMSYLKKKNDYFSGGWDEATIKTTILDIVDSLRKSEEIFHYVQFNPYPFGKNEHPSYLTRTLTLVKKEDEGVVGKDNNVQKWPTCFTDIPWIAGVIQLAANHRLSPPRRIIETVLRRQHRKKNNDRQDLAYKIWNAGASSQLLNMGTGIEFAFPVNEAPAIINLVIEHLQQSAELSPGYYVNGPIAVRFVRASKAFLAPNQAKFKGTEHDWWCYMEIVRLNSNNPEDDEKELEIYEHLQKILRWMGGRPHWGLNFHFPFNLEYLQSIYPDIDRWLAAKAFFDPNKTFESKAIQSWLS
ncbi:D-arabinono-1,4-lactone oxidase [Haliscomenobacter hydrossis]|uniref:D-arabinono-14-lactone oxidase n=1 Tax=Haliscomenobacter hydrossis (strain ATCC 27775 / DSM 1100 / LMG 10767 / O) TaxID=760192 RepID=F4L423_HALH1|nr:D-arabinono-1,4-lactone oxidase [Haliscomenobacter hydrossis]AEE49740.1 D-arabinono-14-lactone oxidase [Haliscomenobacter hydrossis DSM 1100]